MCPKFHPRSIENITEGDFVFIGSKPALVLYMKRDYHNNWHYMTHMCSDGSIGTHNVRTNATYWCI